MKICVLGNGILAQDFERLDYVVLDGHFLDFKIEYVLDFDVIVNTHDYRCDDDGNISLSNMKKCNIDLPFLLSEFCESKNKRYVHISTADLYQSVICDCDGTCFLNEEGACTEISKICADKSYGASKIMGESSCNKKSLIIRTKNMFNDEPVKENALFRAITNTTPSKNEESYSWTVDVIRGVIALLKSKQYGIYNIASGGFISQAEICEKLEISGVAPIISNQGCKYIKVSNSKLMEHIIPMDAMDNIPKCFKKLKDKLGE